MENNSSPKGAKKNKALVLVVGLLIILAAVFIFFTINRLSQPKENSPRQTNVGLNLESGDYEQVELENNKQAFIVAPGASPLTEEGDVLTETGDIARNDVAVMSPEAPHQTNFLVEDDLPDETINIEIKEDSFRPKSFITSPETATFISFSSKDGGVHTITFDDPKLSALAVLVGPNQTKGILFKAPSEPGTYSFRCITPGHSEAGEIGEMIVE